MFQTQTLYGSEIYRELLKAIVRERAVLRSLAMSETRRLDTDCSRQEQSSSSSSIYFAQRQHEKQ